jgi:cholesterol oxidase
LLPEHFDAIVVGSGFGGSVVAFRLAEAGLRVCLLERGKPYPPGSFPRSPLEIQKSFWDPSEGLHGLFDIWSFRKLEVIAGSGLGGGSLIYANVLLRKDEEWFVREDRAKKSYEYWPITRKDLDPHYDAVEKVLTPTAYPEAYHHRTLKSEAFLAAAETLKNTHPGITHSLPPLAITFARPGCDPAQAEWLPGDPKDNFHGMPRTTCRLCGECDLGCNYGSKNTLDHTYLSLAKKLGADIRTRSEVRTFAPRPAGGFEVRYVGHAPEAEGVKTDTSKLPLQTITADRLILSGGSIGTTYLLLRNRDAFAGISKTLGQRLGGNGDLLTFAFNCRHPGKDGESRPRPLNASCGPVITRSIRAADAADGPGNGQRRGFYIQDAGFPEFINWVAQTASIPSRIMRYLKFIVRYFRGILGCEPDSAISAELSEVLEAAECTYSSLPLLGMGRDVADGIARLRGRFLDVDWNMKTSDAYFDRLTDLSRELAGLLGGRFVENPTRMFKRMVSVHPLGGCAMGRASDEGVVDQYGEVFNYPGMFIADGSVMPGPVGANPSLTIAAFADHCADRIIAGFPKAIRKAGTGS